MNQLVSNIKDIPGVVGVAIFKDNGALVAFDFPAAYDKSLLKLIGHKFHSIKDILPKDEGEIVYLCWEFEDILGFYYPVDGGWINIISNENIPMPVLTLTMTAVLKKLPQLLEGAEVLNESQPVNTPSEGMVQVEQLDELKKIFAVYLGPAAPVIFKRAAARLGVSLESFPPNLMKQFLDEVTAKVPDAKKDELIDKISKIIPGSKK
jgi:hypothetical protein